MATTRHVLGSLAATAAGTGAVGGAVLLCEGAARELSVALAADGWTGLAFETLLSTLAAVVLAAGAGWLGLGTLLTAWDLLTGLGHAAASRITPAVVRRVVAVGCGAALGGPTALVAQAADAPGAASPAQVTWRPVAAAHVLSGLPLPDRPAGRGTATRMTGPTGPVHTVRPGDSLWAITARALGPGASVADVVSGWRRLYRANRDRVGDDPGLLLPDTILRLPPTWAAGPAHPTPHREDPS